MAIYNISSSYRERFEEIGWTLKLRKEVIEKSNNLNEMRNILELLKV